jgi:uncharacterized caspase-like protein
MDTQAMAGLVSNLRHAGLPRWLRPPLLVACVLLLLGGTALAEKRVALVVGNSAYRNVDLLPNPERDANSIAKLFRDAGFDTVISTNNVANVEFKRAIRKFKDLSIGADIAVVYYAGHGIEIGGVNYLIPVDAILARDDDAPDEAIALDRMIDAVEGARRLRLIILDACRDNPFAKRIKRMIAVRGVDPGLAKIEPATGNTLIAYAAKAGSTAEDGVGAHSPFTTALLANLTTPGLDIRLAFGRVRDDVMAMTHDRQEPFVYGSLGGKEVALVPEPKHVPPPPPKPVVGDPARDYEFAERIGTKEAWQSFLAAHGGGYYEQLARAALDKLNAADERAKRDAIEQAAKRKAEQQARAEQEAKAKLAAQQAKSAPVVIAMAPANDAAPKSQPGAIDPGDLASLLQFHLKRVGCDPGALDGSWTDKSKRAMALFNTNARTHFDVKVASLGALEAVKEHKARVCPLVCGKGQRAEGDRCVAEACPRGQVRSKNGECVPEAKTAERPTKRDEGGDSNVLCDNHGCKTMPKNCKVVSGIIPGRDEISCR